MDGGKGKARGASRAGGAKPDPKLPIQDYRHDETRKNNPEAALAGSGRVPAVPQVRFAYSARRSPSLLSDPTGKTDDLDALLAEARTRPLTAEETAKLADALRQHQPWLEWSGKRETPGFAVDPVALNIHERVSAQAILRVAARADVTRDLFADPQLAYRDAVKFYAHDVGWANRLILGDSLQVMASLAVREDLAGKVQMIYVDPPYGIRFGSNFQPRIDAQEVKDKEADLTREPEMVKAFRDTWTLGVHSYLAYLRDRFIAAHRLLAPSGSIFVQISDENVHRVRAVLDEVFGAANAVTIITVKKTGGQTSNLLPRVADYLLWYARDIEKIKYRPLFTLKEVGVGEGSGARYDRFEGEAGARRSLTPDERRSAESVPSNGRVYRLTSLISSGFRKNTTVPFEAMGRTFHPGSNSNWKTTIPGMSRLAQAERIEARSDTIEFVRYVDDFAAFPITSIWADVAGATDKQYVVQTSPKVIERCVLMTTDPGDLVLDPTCGGGTTALVAEEWGRRWITIDTSRVAIAIARQAILTRKFDFYRLKDANAGVKAGFVCRTVPRITLKSIAQNAALDPIFAKHQPTLDKHLADANAALRTVGANLRQHLTAKLVQKQRDQGKRAITEADRRRWTLPEKGKRFEHWTMPFDADEDYPEDLAAAVNGYRAAWRAKMDDVNATISAAAEPHDLLDQPQSVNGVTRVSGPFTIEAVQPAETSLDDIAAASPIDGAPGTLDGGFDPAGNRDGDTEAHNVDAYLDRMLRLLRSDGVRFPDNKVMMFSRLEALSGKSSALHAEGRWVAPGESDADPEGQATVAVAFGPQYGPVTAKSVEQLIRAASRRGYDHLVVAGFSFDGAAQAVLDDDAHPELRIHMAHIRPDVNPGMDGLLKDTPAAQLFTVFGQPRSRLEGPDGNGEYHVVMEGVDIYDPLTGATSGARADKVAAWFLDGDYDGRCFCATQAFFPDKEAWSKLEAALKGVLDATAFSALTGTTSLPFKPGPNGCVAVKVVDPRGNEVMRLHRVEGH